VRDAGEPQTPTSERHFRLDIAMLVTPEIIAATAAGVVGAVVILVLLLRRRRATTDGAAPPAAPVADETTAAAPAATLRESLIKTRQGFLTRLQSAWGVGKDAEARLAALEEMLLTADIGVKTTQSLLAKLRPHAKALSDGDALRRTLRDEMRAALGTGSALEAIAKPHVVLVAGVNGVGKTTTIGKLAYQYRQAGKKVLLVAADTFRAAACEQLELWAQRAGAECVRHQAGSDPAAVAHDGIAAAVARGVDVVIVDTAGRLHVKQHLIEELKKIVRIIGRQLDGAPHEVLLVIDATTGQNAINQARVFQEALSVTGIVLTKLDGTAKGGAVFAIRAELGVPIRWVGLGEQAADLQPFDPAAFVDALLATD
jgi:fused signal recognition particle receptor